MKKLIITFLFTSVSLNLSYSQSGWFWQNPLPQGNDLMSVHYISGGNAYACGRSGTIIKTTNDGTNWTILSFPSKIDLRSVFFLNQNTGWTGGYPENSEPNVYFTSNGGVTWVTRSVDEPYAYILSIRFLNESTGFAGGSDLYKSTNGGINWFHCYSPEVGGSDGIFFLNDETGYVSVGAGFYSGKILKTTNCGVSWQTTSFGTRIECVYFINSQTGFAGNTWNILRTTDGGNYWSVIYSAPQYSALLSVSSVNNDNVFACGESGDYIYATIAKSSNGGSNWSLTTYGRILTLRSISFAGSSTGLSVGSNGIILKSSDAGASWERLSHGNLNTLRDISFANSDVGCAVGDSGLILRTSNGGNDWYISNPINSTEMRAVELTDAFTGYAAGKDNSNGIIYKSTNGGANWFISTQPASAPVSTMSWLNNNTGFAGCSNGVLLKTVNGGSNWISSASGLAKIYSLSFIDANTGYALLDTSSSLFKTTNGGVNWGQIATGVSCLYFINPSTGFIAYYNVIRKTTNGGVSWTSYNVIPSGEILAISFFNENTGYAGGSYGYCSKTTNGGQNWFLLITPTKIRIKSIAIATGSIAYLAGEYGMILKTTTGGEPIGIQPISSGVPRHFHLSQNYPNPFNPTTKIKFNVSSDSRFRGNDNVVLKIFDVLGREIAVLVNEQLSPGTYEVEWSAVGGGSNYSSGVYFYRLTVTDASSPKANPLSITKKMVLIK
jgi:photosystem II stability/assembly factor-like uncharacterized protein